MSEHAKFSVRCRAVIIHEGKLLVVQHQRTNAHYALPGGHLEMGEGIEECAKREIMEELGVEPKLGRLLYVNIYTAEGESSVEFFFEVTNGADYMDLTLLAGTHKHELADITWTSPDTDLNILPKRIKGDLKSGQILSNTTRFIN